MTGTEAEELAEYANGLFGDKLNEKQVGWLAGEFLKFNYNQARDAIDTHRATQKFMRLEALIGSLKLRSPQARANGDRPPSLSCWEVYRRESKHLVGLGDVEVSLRVHRAWWFDSRCSRTEGYRNQFATSCRVQLIHAKVTAETLDGLIAAVFDPNVGYFRQVLSEVRELYPTITETDEAARSTEQTEVEAYL